MTRLSAVFLCIVAGSSAGVWAQGRQDLHRPTCSSELSTTRTIPLAEVRTAILKLERTIRPFNHYNPQSTRGTRHDALLLVGAPNVVAMAADVVSLAAIYQSQSGRQIPEVIQAAKELRDELLPLIEINETAQIYIRDPHDPAPETSEDKDQRIHVLLQRKRIVDETKQWLLENRWYVLRNNGHTPKIDEMLTGLSR